LLYGSEDGGDVEGEEVFGLADVGKGVVVGGGGWGLPGLDEGGGVFSGRNVLSGYGIG
jgi:hypothetical protein